MKRRQKDNKSSEEKSNNNNNNKTFSVGISHRNKEEEKPKTEKLYIKQKSKFNTAQIQNQLTFNDLFTFKISAIKSNANTNNNQPKNEISRKIYIFIYKETTHSVVRH